MHNKEQQHLFTARFCRAVASMLAALFCCLLSMQGASAQTCPSGINEQVLDWDSTGNAWTAGTLSNSYTVDTEPLSVSFTGDTGNFINILGGQTPFKTNALTGGIDPAEQAILFVVNHPTTSNSVTLTITAGDPGIGVEELEFTLFDLDTNGPNAPFAFQDRITVTGSLGGTPISNLTLTGSSSNQVLGGGVAQGIDGAGNTSSVANMTISVTEPVDTLTILYDPGPQSQTDPAQQGMSLHDITFCRRVDVADAPASFQSAPHYFEPGIFMGTTAPDSDAATQFTANADGDDTNGTDDEDGTTLPQLTQGSAASINTFINGTGALLQAWIDWNGDGDFDDTVDGVSEQIAIDRSVAGTSGTVAIPVQVPNSATTSQTYARFRLSTDTGLGPTAEASDGEVEDYALTISPAARTVTGTIFEDNGTGGATAHDGLQTGTEAGTGNVTLRLIDDANSTLYSTTQTTGDGSYAIEIPPAAAGRAVRIEVDVSGGRRAISEQPGALPSLSNPSLFDSQVVFTPAADTSYTDVNFGQIADPTLTEDQLATVTAGSTAFLPHTYTATTSGTVTFSLANQSALPAGVLNAALYEDINCNQTIDSSDPLATNATVTAGEQVCLIARVVSSSGAPQGSVLTFDIVADTSFTGTSQTLELRNQDRVSVNEDGAAQLTKEVCNITTSSCDVSTGSGFSHINAGMPGEILQYRITFTTLGPDSVENIEIFDSTPDFTFLKGGSVNVVQAPAGMTCQVITPSGGGVEGYQGNIEWLCDSSVMQPGDQGIVSFRIEIEN
jgi:hypothetical protein